jgi:mersacidin/lichenicidin family type 2 lantibiotic
MQLWVALGNDQFQQRKEVNTMSHKQIIRAWKDEEYRLSLSEAEQALLPENPAGVIELADVELETVGGAGWTNCADSTWFLYACKSCFDKVFQTCARCCL